MEYSKWLQSITDDSQEETAKKIKVSRRTLQNQLYGQLKPETAIKIGEAYGLNPHVVLNKLGFVADHWLAELVDDRLAHAASLTEEELADEVLRRMLRGVETDALTTPVDELATRRSNKADTPDVHPISDDELNAAIERANNMPRAAHRATDTEYTEPEAP